jgi:hypothetical protein
MPVRQGEPSLLPFKVLTKELKIAASSEDLGFFEIKVAIAARTSLVTGGYKGQLSMLQWAHPRAALNCARHRTTSRCLQMDGIQGQGVLRSTACRGRSCSTVTFHRTAGVTNCNITLDTVMLCKIF